MLKEKRALGKCRFLNIRKRARERMQQMHDAYARTMWLSGEGQKGIMHIEFLVAAMSSTVQIGLMI